MFLSIYFKIWLLGHPSPLPTPPPLPPHPPLPNPASIPALPLDLAEQTFIMKPPALLWSSSRAEFRRGVPIATRDLSSVKQEVPLNPCVNGFDP